ncbi:hypothetical protein [Sinomicrobium sp. M5D2P17]
MLTKKECEHAILAWDSARPHYSEIQRLIDPTYVFQFDRAACNWVNKHNKNKYFYTYIGVHNEHLVLIVVPLDKNGKETKLASYPAIPLEPLTKDIILTEKEQTVITKKTTLSKNLRITHASEKTELPTYNTPAINEGNSLNDIETWANSCLDWFYYECTGFKGKRIFKTFMVPFADLIKSSKNYNKVIALFALKDSVIYQRTIPTLIFVAVNNTTMVAQLMHSGAGDQNTEMTNTYDWARPCPPFCRDEPEKNSTFS